MPPRNYRSGSRRSRWPQWLLGGFGLFTLVTVGIVGTLWIAGVPLNPFASTVVPDDPFMVRIPINSKPIPAYTRVDRAHLLNPATGGLMIQRVPPAASVGMSIVGIDSNGSHVESRVEAVKNVNDEVVFVVTGGAEVRQADTMTLGAAMLNINAILGRVVKADKRAGLGFQESTFFPHGTPEGLAGATPQGMRAITLDATRLTGVHSLGAGDQIDLLASVPLGGDSDDSEVQLLAQSAKVLRPVYVRNEVSSSASLMQGKTMQNVPKYEVAIAVAADDVIPLQNALDQKLPITCVAHSMKPESEADAQTMVSEPDLVSVPVTVRPIFAYDVVTRDAFVSPATRALKTEKISRQEADRIGAIVALGDALGSIVRQDIPTGRYLRHSDLLAEPPTNSGREASHQGVEATTRLASLIQQQGTQGASPQATAVGDRPAISRFVPPGMKTFAIPWNRLYGSEHLQIGDRVDLMVSYPLQRLRSIKETESEPDGTVVRREYESISQGQTFRTLEESFGNRGEPWYVATDAVIVGPVGFPPPAPALRALGGDDNKASGRGSRDRSGVTLDGPPIMIAVSDQDAENFAAALVTNEALFSVAIHASDNIRVGTKEIAICPVNIEAYKLFNESIWQNNRRRLMTRLVDAADPRFLSAVDSKAIPDYYGRTLARSKTRWDFFSEDDFLAKGVSPGVAAAVQPGFTVMFVDENIVEGLGRFETEERVTILLRQLVTLPSNVVSAATFDRSLRQGITVVKDARILRRSVTGQVAMELPDHNAAALQSAIALVSTPERAVNKETNFVTTSGIIGNQKEYTDTQPAARLVALGQPRSTATNTAAHQNAFSDVQSFDPRGSLQLTDVIVASERTTYAFQKQPSTRDRSGQ